MVFSWQCTANSSRLPFFLIPLFAFQEAWKHFFSYWFCPLLLNKSCILLNFLWPTQLSLVYFCVLLQQRAQLGTRIKPGTLNSLWVFSSDGSHQNKGLSDSLQDFSFLFHAEIRLSGRRAYQLVLRHYFNKCLWQIDAQRCRDSFKSPFVYFSADMTYINKNSFKLNKTQEIY